MDFPFENPYERTLSSPRTLTSLLGRSSTNLGEPSASTSNIGRKVVKKDSVVFLLNRDTISVVSQFQTFTEMMCLGYSCRFFYYMVQSYLRSPYFWRIIPEMLFKELTSCRHPWKRTRCLLNGLKRVNLSQTTRIEFDEEVTNKFLREGFVEEQVVRIAPKLETIVLPCISLFRKRSNPFEHPPPPPPSEVFLKLNVLVSPDSTYCFATRNNDLDFFDPGECLGIPKNVEKCKKHKNRLCFVLNNVFCSTCEEDKTTKKHCFRTFPYYQKCYGCEKRCCTECFRKYDQKKWKHCKFCEIYYCSGCEGPECELCKVYSCPKCLVVRECLACKKKVCSKCAREFHHVPTKEQQNNNFHRIPHVKYSLVVCASCCCSEEEDDDDNTSKKKKKKSSWIMESGLVMRNTRYSRVVGAGGGVHRSFFVGQRNNVTRNVRLPLPIDGFEDDPEFEETQIQSEEYMELNDQDEFELQ